MFRRMNVALFVAACTAVCWTTVAVQAQGALTRRINFTFSQPVMLPNLTLAPGRYTFEIPSSTLGRHIVHIYNAETDRRLATLLTIPARRTEVPDNAEIRFMEAAASTPNPVRSWWYPGTATGWEVIYPREQAMRLAQSSKEPVLTTARAGNGDMASAELARVNAAGENVDVDAEAGPAPASGIAQRGDVDAGERGAAAPSSTPPAGSRAAAATPSAPATQVARDQPREALPQTASLTPTIALSAAIVLMGGLVLRSWRRNSTG
jgi:hypothetical protein